ncbi:MAG: ABC transporter permease [Candidatus Thermoplasmatota archaeon]|nr:ABC transporter permease [Candidatus Thermoplasmatota archaeon]
MAKRRKEGDEEKEQLDFQIPKFDEAAFIKRERRNIKTLFLSFLFGLLISVICFGFWVLIGENFLRWELVLLVGVVNSIWLKYLFLKLNIDLADFGRKGWLSSFVTYFFTWLLVLIVLVNPPFYDGEAPHVDVVVLPGMQEPGGDILFVAQLLDNVGVNTDGITLTIIDPNGTTITPVFTYEDTILRYTYTNPDGLLGTFNYTLVVADVNGMKTTTTGSFTYGTDALEIILAASRFTDLTSMDVIPIKADERISKDNFRVYYTVNNGTELNAKRMDPNEKEEYETSAEFEGWSPNANHTVHLYAEARYYFLNNPEEFSNIVQDTRVYQFSTSDDPNIGTEDPLVEWNYSLPADKQLQNTLNYPLPYPRIQGATPGFELLLAVLALVIVVLLVKKNKKHPKS